jgi:hypothetical protein
LESCSDAIENEQKDHDVPPVSAIAPYLSVYTGSFPSPAISPAPQGGPGPLMGPPLLDILLRISKTNCGAGFPPEPSIDI